MARYGYTLYCKGFDPRDLVKQAVLAEKAGYVNMAVAYPGQDTKGYMKRWRDELRPLLP